MREQPLAGIEKLEQRFAQPLTPLCNRASMDLGPLTPMMLVPVELKRSRAMQLKLVRNSGLDIVKLPPNLMLLTFVTRLNEFRVKETDYTGFLEHFLAYLRDFLPHAQPPVGIEKLEQQFPQSNRVSMVLGPLTPRMPVPVLQRTRAMQLKLAQNSGLDALNPLTSLMLLNFATLLNDLRAKEKGYTGYMEHLIAYLRDFLPRALPSVGIEKLQQQFNQPLTPLSNRVCMVFGRVPVVLKRTWAMQLQLVQKAGADALKPPTGLLRLTFATLLNRSRVRTWRSAS